MSDSLNSPGGSEASDKPKVSKKNTKELRIDDDDDDLFVEYDQQEPRERPKKEKKSKDKKKDKERSRDRERERERKSKKRSRDDRSDDDSDNDDRCDVEEEKRPDGETMFHIHGKKKLTVSKFKNQVLVSIREYYEKDGELRPTQKGCALPVDAWNNLKKAISRIDKAIDKKF